jgi:hypothetical protein
MKGVCVPAKLRNAPYAADDRNGFDVAYRISAEPGPFTNIGNLERNANLTFIHENK